MSSIKFRAVSEHQQLADVLTDVLTLGGVIDEDHELESALEDVTADALRIDLGGVERINEVGARAWNTFIEALLARGVELTMIRCSPAVVGQLNRNPTGVAGVIIESVVVPYFCPECDEPRGVCCPTYDIEGTPPSPPVRRCESCDLVLEFDDNPKAYFRFLSNQNLEDSGLSRVAEVSTLAPEASTSRGIPFAILAVALIVLGAVVAYAAGLF